MAFPAQLYTQTQLAVAVGGADKLLELADRAVKSGQITSAGCQQFLSEVLLATSGEVNSILEVAFDPNDPNYANAAFVQEYALTIAVYWTWHKSTGGLSVPKDVRDGADLARSALKEAREGLRSLGTSPATASNAGATSVTIDTTGQRILRTNLNGFC
jgi:hypothetical protein